MPLDLLVRIDSWSQLAPDHLAHISGDRALTFAELIARSDALAACLSRTLTRPQSPVVVLGHKEPEMLIAFLGAVKAGHPYVPLDTSLPKQRVERIIESSGTELVLTPDRVVELAAEHAPDKPRPVQWNDPYYIIFTSGSTGEPKGVVITLESLTSFVEWMLAEQKPADLQAVFLNQAPFSFDLSVMDLYLSLVTGGTLFSITAEQIANPRQLYGALASSNLTTWVSTPSFAQMCLVEKSFDAGMLPHVRRFLFCGETLAPEVVSQLLDRFPGAEVWNTYGPTEATCATTSIKITRQILAAYSPLPVGFCKPDARIVIMDEEANPVAAGERGEIIIAGPNVSTGYLGRPDLNEKAFFRLEGMRAYRTGDWGRLEDGLLFFEGRKDDQVKLHGYRIELGDIEAHLRALRGIRDAVVIPNLKQGRADSLSACVILSEPGARLDFDRIVQLKAALGQQLPNYMIPRKFLAFERFPLTPNGKADRRRLAEMLNTSGNGEHTG